MAGYKEVAKVLAEKIRAGDYDDNNGRLPIIDELCVEFEVSRVTMQRTIGVLKKEGLVHTSPKKGISTTRLKRPRTYMIGALLKVAPSESHLHNQIFSGMQRMASSHGCAVAVQPKLNGSMEEAIEAAHDFVDRQKVDGVVIWNTSIDQDMTAKVIEVFKEAQLPYVLAPECILGEEHLHHHVVGNEASSVQEIFQHLRSMGHEKIAFASNFSIKPGTFFEKRYLAYRQEMERADLSPLRVVKLDEPKEKLLESIKSSSAIFCVTDDAMAVMVQVAMNSGIRIPDELLLVGYDNTRLSTALNLSSVDQRFDQIGEQAVEILIDEVDGKYDDVESRQIKGELIIRTSRF